MPIHFFQEEVKHKMFYPLKVKDWVKLSCKNESFKVGEINYIFCNDEYLLKLNLEYLKHDTLTDIITFDYSNGKNLSGDIFISLSRVEENSKKFLTTFNHELLRVMIHGTLHLMGYKDKTKSQKILMRKKEDEYLSLWERNVPRGTSIGR
jgi:rRNA maturation RNase YbeY